MSEQYKFLSGHELLALPAQNNDFLIDGILWEKEVVVLMGDAKCGKSILAQQMAFSLTSGTPFLGEYEVSGPQQVVYIQAEGRCETTKERAENMLYDGHVQWNPSLFYLFYKHSIPINTQDGFTEVVSLISEHQLRPNVIFIDPAYMAMQGDLSDNVAVRGFFAACRKLSMLFDCAVVIIHHKHVDRRNLKGDVIDEGDKAVMGSFVWRAYPDHVILLYKQNDGLRNLSCTTQRSARVIQNMKMELMGPKPLYYAIHGTPDHAPYVDKVLACIADKGPLTAKDMAEITELSRSAIMKSLSYLLKGKQPKITRINPGKRPVLYDVAQTISVPCIPCTTY